MSKSLRQAGFLFALFLPPIAAAQQPPSLPALKQEAASEVDKLETLTQQMVDQVFSFSELGFQEFETSRHLTEILEKNGFQVDRGVAGIPTAWVAPTAPANPRSPTSPTSTAFPAPRKSPASPITIHSSQVLQATEKATTPAWP